MVQPGELLGGRAHRADRAVHRGQGHDAGAGGGEVGVRAGAGAAVDVRPAVDRHRRVDAGHRAARGDGVEQGDAVGAGEAAQRAGLGVDRGHDEAAVRGHSSTGSRSRIASYRVGERRRAPAVGAVHRPTRRAAGRTPRGRPARAPSRQAKPASTRGPMVAARRPGCDGCELRARRARSREQPVVTCAPTTEPADVPTTRSAAVRSTPRLLEAEQQPGLPRDAGDAAATQDQSSPLVHAADATGR